MLNLSEFELRLTITLVRQALVVMPRDPVAGARDRHEASKTSQSKRDDQLNNDLHCSDMFIRPPTTTASYNQQKFASEYRDD